MSDGAGLLVAVDAGNSKTDALLVDRDGNVHAQTRGGGFVPQSEGVDAAMSVLTDTVDRLLHGVSGPVDHLAAYLAGADLPYEEKVLHDRIVEHDWARTVRVGNDTLALLRTGAAEGRGVAVVCGAGINAVGVGPGGRVERFPALGALTGDWGGGHVLGGEMLWFAVRGEDGRGEPTALSDNVAAHFGMPTALDAALAMHDGSLPRARIHELTPVLFDVAARGDHVAGEVVARLATEIAVMASALITRLGLGDQPCPVVLGGGVIQAGHQMLLDGIRDALARTSPLAACEVASVAPVVGAAMLGLDEVGADPEAARRLLQTQRST